MSGHGLLGKSLLKEASNIGTTVLLQKISIQKYSSSTLLRVIYLLSLQVKETLRAFSLFTSFPSKVITPRYYQL